MQIESKRWNGWFVLKPTEKRIDIYSAGKFKEEVIELIQNDSSQLLLDLSMVDFIDSSGLGAIISIFKTIAARGDLALCNVRPTVMSLFRLTRMDRVFPIFKTEVEAVEHGDISSSRMRVSPRDSSLHH